MSGDEVGSSVRSSRDHGYGKRDRSSMGNFLGGVSNGKSAGNFGESSLGGVIGAASGMGSW